MLFLSRKVGQSIMINGDITVTVAEIRSNHVRLSFSYPKTSQILRKEVYDRIQEENKQAASHTDELTQLLQAHLNVEKKES